MRNTAFLLFLFTIWFLSNAHSQVNPPEPYGPVPSGKQLAWHEMEQYAFVHFTTNTFTGKEWGYGDESPQIVNPTDLNVTQWVKTIKEAGLKGIVLTCKHHDGFCLWPSKYTDHSIKNSPYKNGKGDIVKEVSDACHQYGIKFGIYLSPWDRNRSDYGSPSYIEYYRNQLNELFTQYGPAFEMWFDGANGGDGFYGGAKEKRKINGATYYDWPKTLAMVRKLEPNIVFFSDGGPDIRWCGNEDGFIGETNWNRFSNDTIFAGMPNITGILNSGQEDGEHWVPAEVDVSIRPGWFYHSEEDSKVKSPEKLFDIYLKSVGRGSNLILNIPPDRRGHLHENDVQSLMEWKKLIDQSFKINLAANATVQSSSTRGSLKLYGPENVLDGNKETYWTTDDNIHTGYLEINLGKPQKLNFLVIQEYIKLGQRVKSFTVEAWEDNSWKQVATATTIGYKRILKLNGTETSKIRVTINESKACPVISSLEVF
jgi:alpha-L-fucosidase